MVFFMEKGDVLHLHCTLVTLYFSLVTTQFCQMRYTHRLVGMTSFHIIQISKTRDTTSDDLYACIQLFSENCITATETCQLHNP